MTSATANQWGIWRAGDWGNDFNYPGPANAGRDQRVNYQNSGMVGDAYSLEPFASIGAGGGVLGQFERPSQPWSSAFGVFSNGNIDISKRYWVGGTATWDNTAGTKWSYISGGGGGENVPYRDNNVYIDANSGAVTITADGTNDVHLEIGSLDFTGFAGTFKFNGTGTNAFSMFGPRLVFSAAMTYDATGGGGFNAQAGITLNVTSNGAVLANSTFGAKLNSQFGNILLLDAANLYSMDVGAGDYDLNDLNHTAGLITASDGAAGTLFMRSGTVTINTSGYIQLGTTDGLYTHLNAGTSTLKLQNGATCYGRNQTFNNIWCASGGTNQVAIKSNATFNDFKIDAGVTVRFEHGTAQTISTLTVPNSSANAIILDSDDGINSWSINDTNFGTNQVKGCTISRSVASGAYFLALLADNNVNGGQNIGWTFILAQVDGPSMGCICLP